MTNSMPQSHVHQDWRSLPRPAAAPSALDQILGKHADPDSFSEPQLNRLRRYIAASVPVLPCSELETFLGELFLAPELVSAYFRPTVVGDLSNPALARRNVLPFEKALAAARKAQLMRVLLPQERGLAWLAAFTYPCGIFAAADPSLLPQMEGKRFAQPMDPRVLRSLLIEDGIRKMRVSNQPLADTFAAVLDFGVDEQCDPQQVARVLTAVRMAVVDIERLWRGWA